MKFKDYIVDRLCEQSTWRGIYLSMVSLLGILILYVEPKTLVLLTSITTFLMGQTMVWTKDHKNTTTKIDDILYAAATAFKTFKSKDADTSK